MNRPIDDGPYGLDEIVSNVHQAMKTARESIAAGDARHLLAHVLDVDAGRISIMGRDPLTRLEFETFGALVQRRAAREPVSHLIGKRSFYGRDLIVNADVLDPRPDTETLIATALQGTFQSVLDLGTGSGAIILTLLAERQDAHGIATDVSAPALQVALRNAESLGVANRLEVEKSDWYEHVGGQFDLIVSNPPYIAASEMADLQPEVRDHEPRIALTDEADGLTHYRHIISNHDPYLIPGGRLMVEIGPTQADAVTTMMAAANLTEITVIPDLDGRDRVVWGRKPRKTA